MYTAQCAVSSLERWHLFRVSFIERFHCACTHIRMYVPAPTDLWYTTSNPRVTYVAATGSFFPAGLPWLLEPTCRVDGGALQQHCPQPPRAQTAEPSQPSKSKYVRMYVRTYVCMYVRMYVCTLMHSSTSTYSPSELGGD